MKIIHQRFFIVLACGSLLRRLIDPIFYGIQSFPISTWLGYENVAIGYFAGWLAATVLLVGILSLLSWIIHVTIKSRKSLKMGYDSVV